MIAIAINENLFDAIKIFLLWIEKFFIIYLIVYSTFLFVAVIQGSVSLYIKKRQEKFKNTLLNKQYIPVSVIVPAYNEEVTVVETVHSLLALEYPLYEIVVVDDGSTDRTSQKLIKEFNLINVRRPIQRKIDCQVEEFVYESLEHKVPITLIRKKNGGKADTLNMGINACRFPYFICMDADSVLQYDSLDKIVKPILEDQNVVAVGGVVRPSNSVEIKRGRVKKYSLPRNILACMQVVEYDRSFLASRILFDKFNGSMIISGAFGLFKKDAVIDIGGYDSSTMGEDMELVVKMHDYCVSNEEDYLIRYATDAVCWSQVPEKLSDLCKQRRRWHIGLFQSMWKHKIMLANPKFGLVSFISYFYFLIFELLSPFIEIVGVASMFLALAVNLINIPFMLIFFGIYAAFGSVITMTSFFARIQTIDLKISFKDFLKALTLCTLEITGLRFIMAWVRATAFIGYKKKKLRWDKLERKKIDLK